MPSNADRILTADEQRFIRHYARGGFNKDAIQTAERMARIKRGEGDKYLRRAHVQEEICRRKMLLETAQATIDAQDINRRETDIEQLFRITAEEAESELRKLIKLDAATHGSIKLDAIKTALVYIGAIEQGTTRRVLPPTNPNHDAGGQGGGFYTSLFDRMRTTAPEIEAAASIDHDGTIPASVVESVQNVQIHEPVNQPEPAASKPAKASKKHEVMTVEIR